MKAKKENHKTNTVSQEEPWERKKNCKDISKLVKRNNCAKYTECLKTERNGNEKIYYQNKKGKEEKTFTNLNKFKMNKGVVSCSSYK